MSSFSLSSLSWLRVIGIRILEFLLLYMCMDTYVVGLFFLTYWVVRFVIFTCSDFVVPRFVFVVLLISLSHSFIPFLHAARLLRPPLALPPSNPSCSS
jgi:hypothetical protein